MISFGHIISPVVVKPESDLYLAQPITFESMRRAKVKGEASGKLKIGLFTAQFPEDHSIIPKWFTITPDLTRSVKDVAEFKKARKLPMLQDILSRLYEASDAQYLVYTNVDIALQEHFYLAVADYIKSGYDAVVINRRTVPAEPEQGKDLEWLYQQKGLKHSGFDCFVFKRELLEKTDFHHITLGARYIGASFNCVLSTVAKKFKIFEHEHLTFHINNDKKWGNPLLLDYEQHNAREALKIIEELETRAGCLSPLARKRRDQMRALLAGKDTHLSWGRKMKYKAESVSWAVKRMFGKRGSKQSKKG
jgi:hypothetical protein